MRLLAIAALVVSVSRDASADERWYGWKIAASDAAAWSVMLASDHWARSVDDPEDEDDVHALPVLVGLGGVMWLEFGTPLVHLTERNVVGAGASLAMRLALPMAGAVAGSVLDGPASPEDHYAGVGILAGSLTASIVDILFVANAKERAPLVWPTAAVAPGFQGVRLGIGGEF